MFIPVGTDYTYALANDLPDALWDNSYKCYCCKAETPLIYSRYFIAYWRRQPTAAVKLCRPCHADIKVKAGIS